MECEFPSAKMCINIIDTLYQSNKLCNVDFTQFGMQTCCMNDAKTSLVKMLLTQDFFTTYCCKKTVTLGLPLEALRSVLKTLKNNYKITWKCTDDTKLLIQATDGATELNYEFRTVDIESDILDIPEYDGVIQINVANSMIKHWVTQCTLTKGDVVFEASPQQIICSSSSIEWGNMQSIHQINNQIDNQIQLVKGVENIQTHISWASMLSILVYTTLSNTIELGWSTSQPMRVYTDLGQQSYAALYIAPKIQDE